MLWHGLEHVGVLAQCIGPNIPKEGFDQEGQAQVQVDELRPS